MNSYMAKVVKKAKKAVKKVVKAVSKRVVSITTLSCPQCAGSGLTSSSSLCDYCKGAGTL